MTRPIVHEFCVKFVAMSCPVELPVLMKRHIVLYQVVLWIAATDRATDRRYRPPLQTAATDRRYRPPLLVSTSWKSKNR